jgi:methyl-accepting chemotaxis protein
MPSDLPADEAQNSTSFGSILPSLKIKGRLNGGFAAVCIVLIGLVGTTLWQIGGVAKVNQRVVDLRAPTSAASLGMVNGINASLAALRGWMITGNPAFKQVRAAVWSEIDGIKSDMDKLSASWTNPTNVEVWTGFKTILAEFRIAQQAVEKIAKSPDEQPATKILIVEAAPRAAVMVSEITNIINVETTLPATPERKALLGMMADVRGTTARGLANIRAFLLTGDAKFRTRFDAMWTKNKKRFAELKANRAILNPVQQASFDKLDVARTAFLPLPDRMFDIRGSKKWNMANYLLVTQAAPQAGKLMDILAGAKSADGSRSGGMVANQKALLNKDVAIAAASITLLKKIEWALLAFGLALAGIIAFLTARSIVNPVRLLTDAMTQLAGGDKQTEIAALGRTDELGSMAQAVQVFKDNMIENERLQAEQAIAEKKVQEAELQREEESRAAEAKAEAAKLDAEAQAEASRK